MSDANKGPDPEVLDQRSEIWSRYWATGASHSCAGSFGLHYGGAIGAWWRQVFEGLQADERVLDLATGSGAVLQLALKFCTSQDVQLRGVDAGKVVPAWLTSLEPRQGARVRIDLGVRTENLPFADQSYELVTSQFGIEYTDLRRSLAEVRRVLCPGGSLRCVLHHVNSQSVQLARVEVDHIRWLLATGGLLDVVEQLCEPFAQAATPQGRAALSQSHSANLLRERFNQLQDERTQRVHASICPDVLNEASNAVGQIFRTATEQGAAAARTRVQALAQTWRDSEFRLCELIEHALTNQLLQDLVLQLQSQGFDTSAGPLTDAGRLMGWWLRADLSR